MKFNTFEADKEYLLKKFQSPVFDESTGLDMAAIEKGIFEMSKKSTEPAPVSKALAFKYLTENVRIGVDPRDFFPAYGCWNRNERPLRKFLEITYNRVFSTRTKANDILNLLDDTGASRIWVDFDHAVPNWDDIFELGFPGLLERIRFYRAEHEKAGTLDDAKRAFFDGLDITFSAILAMIARYRDYARTHANGSERMLMIADALEALRTRNPRNTYEILLMIYLYFMFGEHFDHFQVRSFGNLDYILDPYITRDLAEGTLTEANVRELIDYFMMQFASINNYWGHPFYLGGTMENGESRINPTSYRIIEEYRKLAITSPKIQIKVAKNTPDKFLNAALDAIRNGSEFLFIGEESVIRAMIRSGYAPEDAWDFDVRGCSEISSHGKHATSDTGGGHANLLKAMELVFHNGVDPRTGREVGVKTGPLEKMTSFELFFDAWKQQTAWIIDSTMKATNDFEQYLAEINPSTVFSGSILESLQKGKDAFFDGCTYRSTELLFVGFGTVIDALLAVREFVYEKKEITLEKLKDILASNWKDSELLRRKIMASPHKYGNHDPEADVMTKEVAEFISGCCYLHPNGRGGRWMPSLHCARQFIDLAAITGATPDGRFDGMECSKNASPAMGFDRSGVTALIESVTTFDSALFPGAEPLDVMMHPSSVAGEDGLAAWRALLRTFFARNGISIQFNLFDAATLRDAQKHPDHYEGLQVRVCGWNVRFNDMAKSEQDMYIRRAENIAE